MKRHTLYIRSLASVLFLTGSLFFTAACSDDEMFESDNTLATGEGISFGATINSNTWEPDTRSNSERSQNFVIEGDGMSITATIVDGIEMKRTEQQPQSRGAQVTAASSVQAFDVAAFFSETSQHFFTEEVNNGVNTAGNTYYWPQEGNLDFIATYPQGALTLPTDNYSADDLSFTYTIQNDVAKQQDVMVAWQKGINNGATGAAVPLQFQHLLAAVQFKMGDMIATQVNSITISGIKGGAVTFRYSDGKWTPTSYGDTNTSYALSLEGGTLANTLILDDGADISGNDNNSMLLLVPQTAEKIGITVNYTEILVADSENNTSSTTSEKTVYLENLTLEAGKTYSLTLNINSGLSIEIPSPEDQDAHFVMVNLAYDLSKIPTTVTNLKVSVSDFEYENEDDEGKLSTNEDAYIIKYKDRSETHKRGYWAKKDIITTNTYNSNGVLTETKQSEDIHLSNENRSLGLGYENAALGTDNSILLFLGENNGECDRNVVLRVTGEYNGETITIGSGRFTQLCPSWNGNQYGCERIEEVVTNSDGKKVKATYPFGFFWDKKATYSIAQGLQALIGAFSRAAFENILKIDLDETTVGQHGDVSKDFISYEVKEYSGWLIKFRYISSVTFNYNALSSLSELTTEENGLLNTVNLFNHVGGVNISDVEEELDNLVEDYTLNIFSMSIKLIGSEKSGSQKDVKTDYAAAEALKCNEVIGSITISNVDGNDPIYNYGFTIAGETINWYLPSSDEAKQLSDETYPLDGIYWSSTAGDDTNKWAYSYQYNNNILNTSYGTGGVNAKEPRSTPHQIRAVRKKP